MIILKKDFNKEQEELSKKLLDELKEECDSLDEYSITSVYGLELLSENNSLLLKIEYSDPENSGNNTLFDCY